VLSKWWIMLWATNEGLQVHVAGQRGWYTSARLVLLHDYIHSAWRRTSRLAAPEGFNVRLLDICRARPLYVAQACV
jgi:hypothetical protein